MKIGINGRFYSARVTGVQRFAREVTAELATQTDVALFLPRGVSARGFRGSAERRSVLTGHLWEQLELPKQARRTGCDIVLNLSGPGPLWGPRRAVVIHDVLAITHPYWFTRQFAAWYRVMLGESARRAEVVI